MHSDFISSTRLCQTGESLKLITPPDSYQRARYEKELDEDLRYVSTPSDNGIELQVDDSYRFCIFSSFLVSDRYPTFVVVCQ
jgi:hypothetical protein